MKKSRRSSSRIKKIPLPIFVLSLVTLAISTLIITFLSLRQQTDVAAIVDFENENGQYRGNEKLAQYGTNFVDVPAEEATRQSSVLGESSADKRIEVDLSLQRLYAFEGDQKVYDFLISSGKWGRTPTGEFTIWSKFKYTKMSGGSKELGTYYYLPNVPYVMFFQNAEVPGIRGFSIHGTYWHDNFGTPMSHGCVNMKTEEAALIYDWAGPTVPSDKKSIHSSKENPGTKVIIYGVAPS